MRLRDSESDARFRKEVRAWLAENLPVLGPRPAYGDWPAKKAYDQRWQRMLFDAGYAGIDWPAAYGGRGATASEQLIFLAESAAAGAPDLGVHFVGQLHAGPTLIAEATDEQRDFHLPRILRGESIWCQGFSEPGAGSDLASLRTRAVRDGDHYVVTGSKIWTSYGFAADYCELLVRTDPDAGKHRGISWLIMPMDTPGIDVRPLRTIQGESEFAEMFLDEVRVPVENLVGRENDGWRVAMVTFSFERGTSLVRELLTAMTMVEELATLAKTLGHGQYHSGPRAGQSRTAWDDDAIRREIGQVAAELDAMWALTRRNVTRAAGGGGVPPSGGSAFKLTYSEAIHHFGEVAMKVLERYAISLDALPLGAGAGLPVGRHIIEHLHAFAISIGAGTSQIQKNILAERVLGLPRER
ncbi:MULTISPECIES: acyl-CoA dehydrogenase family protein [unclassified Pseudofrankia]|uniref:acyl-CoA dehydrogenase family protein n=1 Tax=unclassified Pseudofrankia TaxID=2994372 RepID=UPI0008DA27E2|nr:MULTISPECIES: acyl-CoA dehydrogenase family protein [unclassified Pseudofrankia]MDT3444202.1 acyl-CoA dehydrogenase family protein [Pseudofrankia sp. BMG5.37]OHV65234.1 acyl-CoA dehydrogenase [Pseudofrankia sp. BMG5.36]